MPSPKRNVVVSVITQGAVALGSILVAVVIFTALVRTRPQAARIDDPPAPRKVEVMRAVAVPVRRQWEGFGTAGPLDEADIPAEVVAVVKAVPAGIIAGAPIDAGDVFARLEDTDFQIEAERIAKRIAELDGLLTQLALEEQSWKRRVELAAEDVAFAEADLERVRNALERGAARDREVDQIKQKVVAAVRIEVEAREQYDRIAPRRAVLEAQRDEWDAQGRLAEKNIERCTIRSPLSGVIAAVDVEVGESLAPGKRVGYVVNLDRMEVALRLPSSSRPAVAVGDDVELEALGPTDQRWVGHVSRISPIDDQNTRTMTVYVEIVQDPQAPGWLAPGRFVRGRVISQHTEMRTVVPRRSLLGGRLLLVEDGAVVSRPVTVDFHVQGRFAELGVDAEQWAVLADELDAGSKVVVNAVRSLSDGARVEPISQADARYGDAHAGAGR